MDIPNLSQNIPTPVIESQPPIKNNNTKTIIIIVVILGIISGFWVSRFWPLSQSSSSNVISNITQGNITSADTLKSESDLVVGKLYGDTAKTFKDSATGTIEKGSVNGEGTHILNREGGKSQQAALTSSVIDLDLFVGKKVEVKGETNSSNKAGWLMDVGVIKILQ